MTAPPPPVPKSLLGRHRMLAPMAAVHVSPICLGAMNFGNAWKESMGECSKETAFELMDYFYDQGGNFIDTCVTIPSRAMPGVLANESPAAPTITKLKSRKHGLANGWPRQGGEMK